MRVVSTCGSKDHNVILPAMRFERHDVAEVGQKVRTKILPFGREWEAQLPSKVYCSRRQRLDRSRTWYLSPRINC